jgi:acyl-CoA thioesterase I
MMNALIYHVLSGQAYFSGVALIQIAWLIALCSGGRWPAVFRAVAACAGLILIAVSATPLPTWFYLIAGPVTLFWIWLESSTRTTARRSRLWFRCAVPAMWGLGIALELPFHLLPALPVMGNPPVFVIGDSLSAGIGGKIETWPKLLSRRNGIVVHDLSVSGADVTTAMQQAVQVSGAMSLVIVEIGGNDVLRENAPEVFERGLDALLARLRDGGRTVVLLELPLPPFCNRYGEVQRRLARRHGVLLIPKRVLMGILTAEGATLDTVHLSGRGQELMAGAIWGLINHTFSRL